MHFLKYCLLYFLLVSIPALALETQDLLPVEEAFNLSAYTDSNDQLIVQWDIADGYYLYKDKTKIISQTAAIELQAADFPTGKIKHDDYFGDMETFRNVLKVTVPLLNPEHKSTLKLKIKHQGCADIGVCYPPQSTQLTVDLPVTAEQTADPINKLVQGIKGFTLNALQDDLLPADQAFQFFAQAKDAQTIHVSWKIAEGYYLYRNKIQLSLQDSSTASLGAYELPHGEAKYDEVFGNVEIFHQDLSFDIPLLRKGQTAQNITLLAKYQGCADRGVCYPPMQKTINIELPAGSASTTASSVTTKPDTLVSEQQQIVNALQHDSLWLTLASFFGFGLLLSFTPCVFPMIPILSGIIVGQGDHVTTRRAFLLSLCFVLASAATYTVFGVMAALFGSNLQILLQQTWVIVLFSAVFVLLSLSMFGFYHLELPKSWQASLHNSSERHRNGGYVGVAIMGALSSLIVGPCVAAPLAGALIYIGQTGDALLGGSALFVMGLGMGIPLLIIGASAGSLLPKAGTWLNATKAVFGVLMLAVAVWMLERVIPAKLTMLLWSMLLIIPAIYLSAIDPLPDTASNWRKLWKGTGVMGLVYGVLLLIGLSMGNTNPLKPLQGFKASPGLAATHGVDFKRVSTLAGLDEMVAQAASQKKWVMLDFYADWCISCKEMENYTFTNAKVKQNLANMLLLQVDVTKNSTDDIAFLQRYNLIGPPAILFFDPEHQERPELRVIGYQDAETFINHLQHTQT